MPSLEITEKKFILVYGGASSDLTYKVVKLAFDNDIILIRLPPHDPLHATFRQNNNKMLIDYNRENPGTFLPNK